MEHDAGADIDDGAALSWQHDAQRRPHTIHRAHVSDVRHAPELGVRHVEQAAIDAVAGRVDPGVCRAELRGECPRRLFQGVRVGDVRHRDRAGGAGGPHILKRRL